MPSPPRDLRSRAGARCGSAETSTSTARSKPREAVSALMASETHSPFERQQEDERDGLVAP
jgi:hypothetical protein